MALRTTDPDDVWAYFDVLDGEGLIPLPVEMADDICASCRHLIPDTPAYCCWYCTWDLEPSQVREYEDLRERYEIRVLAALATIG